jgi:small-conductance mechanosensitive channel/CRP-like cAMP-binding protein
MTPTAELAPLPLLPAAALVVGFPLAILLLTEFINSGQRRGRAITPTLRVLRNLVLPALAAMLFVTEVWQLPTTDTTARLVQTGFWLCLLYALLTFINDGIFGHTEPGSWQERVPTLFRDLAKAALVAVGAAIIYSQVWQRELGGALTALGLGSIVIGLALQEPLGNIVSGLMLLFERPLNIGDWVVADGTTGKVIEINWRSVHVETLLHEMRIIPNVSLYKQSFSNLSRPTHDRTDTYDVGFSYDHPPNQVKGAMLELLQSTPGVLRAPPPEVHTLNYGDFSITYRLYFTVSRHEELLPVRDAILSRIWYVARRHGLQIPFPIQMEYRPSESPSAPPVTAGELLEQFPRYRHVRAGMADNADGSPHGPAHEVPDAAGGDDGQATEARVVCFAAGEEMLAFGAAEQAFALVVAGRAEMHALDADGQEQQVALLGPGDFYGDATVSTGHRSEFRVVATTDVTVVCFDAMLMADRLQHSSGLAAEIGDAIDSRRRAAQQLRRRRPGATQPGDRQRPPVEATARREHASGERSGGAG